LIDGFTEGFTDGDTEGLTDGDIKADSIDGTEGAVEIEDADADLVNGEGDGDNLPDGVIEPDIYGLAR